MSQSKSLLIAGMLILVSMSSAFAVPLSSTSSDSAPPSQNTTKTHQKEQRARGRQLTVPSQYVKLRNLLSAGRWKEADAETFRVMLAVAHREKGVLWDSDSMKKFPCSDLSTIDQLWVKYSNGRFGFSVQSRIYKSLGGTESFHYKVWNTFGDRIGWRVNNNWLDYNDLTFDRTAKKGHLPVGHIPRQGDFLLGGMKVMFGGGYVRVWGLFSRVQTCIVTNKAQTVSSRFNKE